MNEENRLQSYMKVWKDVYIDKINSEEKPVSHLSDEQIYLMAEDGGMERADPGMVDHLSLCPVCTEKWADWREAISMVETDEMEQVSFMTYGLLKAAGTELKEPLSIRSGCGQFELGVYPQVDDPERGLITLDVIREDDVSVFEGRHVEVRDRNGRIILAGNIRQGRLARQFESLVGIDLGNWTIVEKGKETS